MAVDLLIVPELIMLSRPLSPPLLTTM